MPINIFIKYIGKRIHRQTLSHFHLAFLPVHNHHAICLPYSDNLELNILLSFNKPSINLPLLHNCGEILKMYNILYN